MIRLIHLAAVAALVFPIATQAQNGGADQGRARGSPTPLADAEEARLQFRAACGPSILRHCSRDVYSATATADAKTLQRGKVHACLTPHAATLSAECRAAMVALLGPVLPTVPENPAPTAATSPAR